MWTPGLSDCMRARNSLCSGYGYRHRGLRRPLLHDDLAAALADLGKPVLGEHGASCFPKRAVSLPNRDLKRRHEHLGVQSGLELGFGGGLEEQVQGFDQVRPRLVDGGALAESTSTSGHRATYPSPSRSMMAVS